jgi:7-keto-8-aminopelargonate synthetase-like enzyme
VDGTFAVLFISVALHDRASIWVVVTEHGGVGVLIISGHGACGDSVFYIPDITRRSLLVISLNSVRLSH